MCDKAPECIFQWGRWKPVDITTGICFVRRLVDFYRKTWHCNIPISHLDQQCSTKVLVLHPDFYRNSWPCLSLACVLVYCVLYQIQIIAKPYSLERRSTQKAREHFLLYISVAQLLFTFGPFFKNVTTCGPLRTKWCIKQQIYKIKN